MLKNVSRSEHMWQDRDEIRKIDGEDACYRDGSSGRMGSYRPGKGRREGLLTVEQAWNKLE